MKKKKKTKLNRDSNKVCFKNNLLTKLTIYIHTLYSYDGNNTNKYTNVNIENHSFPHKIKAYLLFTIFVQN